MGNIDRLGFNSFFPNEKKLEYSEYAKSISSRMILQLASVLNTSLLFLGNSSKTQKWLMDKLLVSLSLDDRQKIIPLVYEFIRNPSMAIINRVSNLKIIEKELTDFRQVTKEDETERMTLNFFKLYLVVNDEVDLGQTPGILNNSGVKNLHDLGLRFLLPAHLPYFELLSKDFDFQYHMELSKALMTYLENDRKYSIRFQDFLQELGMKSSGEYLYGTLDVLIRFFKMASEEKNLLNFKSISLEDAPRLYSKFCGDPYFDYNVKKINNKSDFTSIRAKPIMKLDNNSLLVLDIPFLYDKIYQGLVFDFLNYLKKVEDNHRAFEIAKSEISQNFTHKFFNDIVKECFEAEGTVLKFEGIADCYLRQDNHVVLFEFKDEIIPVSTKFEIEYEKIIAGIFEKFVWESKTNKAKGVTQLINAIEKLDKNFKGYDALDLDGLEKGKISIFPVIVYTDMTLDFPGINRILDGEFKKRLKAIPLNKIGRINGLVLINFKILLLYKHCFKNSSIKLIELFEGLYKEIDRKMMAEPYIRRDIESVFSNLTGSTQFFSNFIKNKGCLENESSFRQIVTDLISENKKN